MDWIAHRQPQLTDPDSLTREGRDALFREFYEDAARAFQWPSPFDLARSWISHLRDATPWSATKFGWWCLGEANLRTRYSLGLLERFVQEPFGAGYPSGTMPDLGQTTFCYTMYHDLIELPAKHFDRNGGTLSGRLESYVFLGMKQILQNVRSTAGDREIVDQHLRYVPLLIEAGPSRKEPCRTAPF